MKRDKIIVCSLIIFYLYFFSGTYIGLSPTLSGWIANGLTLLFILLLLKDLCHLWDKEFRWLNLCIIGFCIVSILSVKANIDYIGSLRVTNGDGIMMNGVENARGVTYRSIGLILSALFIERLSKAKKVHIFLKTLLICIGTLLIFVDIDAMRHVVILDSIEGYLIGNKFSVCYLNLYFCTFYYMLHPSLNKSQKYLLLLFLFIFLIVSIHTQCSTTVMAAMVFFILVFWGHGKIKRVLSSPLTIFFTLFVCDVVFFFGTTWFLQYPMVQDFIVNVLHEDLTLTGRLNIYLNIQDAFDGSPWIGYGVGNSNIISRMYTGALDSQNGLVDLFIQVGIIGLVFYLLSIYHLVKQVKGKVDTIYPMIVFIYSIFAISMVEIPFGQKFLLITFLLLTKEGDTYNKTLTKYSK